MLSFPTIAAVTMVGAGGRPEVTQPAEDLLAAAAHAGFRGIGIDWFTLREAESRGVELRQLAELGDELGLMWTDLAALGLDADDSKDAGVSRSMARRCLALGIPVCGLVISEPPSATVYARVARCAEIFNGAGVRLALEFLPYSGIQSLEQARDVCAHVGYDACGLMIDSLHLARTGGSAAEVAELDAGQIACVQLADGAGQAPPDLPHESRNARRLPGWGELDLTAFTAALKGIGYSGTVSIEVLATDLRELAPAELTAAFFAAGVASLGS